LFCVLAMTMDYFKPEIMIYEENWIVLVVYRVAIWCNFKTKRDITLKAWFTYACGMPALSLFTAVDAYILLLIIWLNC
jgi:hypothetical protein